MQTLVRDARRHAWSVRVGYLAWWMRGKARRVRERWGHRNRIDGAAGDRAAGSSTEAASARCLVVVCGRPWEQRLTGRVLRHLALLRGLRRVGPVDCWCLEVADDAAGPRPAPGLGSAAPDGVVTEIPYRIGRSGRVSRLRWFMSGRRPTTPWELSRLALTPSGPTIRDLTARAASYESVWVLNRDAAQLLLPLIDAGVTPVVVDLDDLIDQQCRQSLELFDARRGPGLLRARHRAFLQRSAGAWERWNRRVVEAATCTLVTNADDAARLSDDRVAVVPNGCVIPGGPVQRERTAGLVRILYQGVLFYEPNRDAAITLVTEIAPRLEALIGATFEIRLVGETMESLAWLGETPRVTMTGYVEDIEDELRRATLVAVPLEVGSGTRLKILEAWAHRIPVVSTALGCAGLGAQHGVHLLVADGLDAFAAACARLVVDPDLAERLAAKAYALAVERYDWSIIDRQVADLRRRVSGASRSTAR